MERQGLGDDGGYGRLALGQGLRVGVQQGPARGGERSHPFWDAEIADTDFPQHRFHIGTEAVDEVLRQSDRPQAPRP